MSNLDSNKDFVSENVDVQYNNNNVISSFNVKIGLPSAVLFVTGSIIGTGIFLTPNSIAKAVPSVLYSIIIWIVCAILSILAALCYTELALLYPQCGGEYNYFEHAYHSCISFSFLLTTFILIKPAVIALLMIFFIENLLDAAYPEASELPYWSVRLLACLTLFVLSVLNSISMKVTLQVSNILTYCKLVCIGIIIVIGFYNLGIGKFEHLNDAAAPIDVSPSKISLAIYAGTFAFGNWNAIAYIAEDLKNPKKNIILSTILSLLLVTVCYILTYFSYMVALGIDGVINSNSVAVDTVRPYFGKASPVIAVLVSLSALGVGSATYIYGSRVIFDGARNGHLPPIISSVNKNTNTMIVAYFLQTLLTILYILFSPDIEKLLVYFSNGSWAIYGAAMLAVIVIRYRLKPKDQIFKVPLLLAGFMTCASIALVVLSFMDDAQATGISIGLMVVCIPVYFIFVYKGGIWPVKFKVWFNKYSDILCEVFDLVIPADRNALQD